MGTSQTYQIIRKNVSSYQGDNFLALEKKYLEIIPEILYQEQERENLKKIVITTSNSNISEFENRDDIALMIHPNSGYDNYSADFVKQANYSIIIGNKIRMNAVSTYIMSALLTHSSKIQHSSNWDSSRKWNRTLLSDRKILIIGHGHIGKKIELMLKTIGSTPTIYDPFKGYNDLCPNGVEVVIMACSLNPTSNKMINKEFLSKLSPNYIFINAARGGCVDQKALLESLKMNKDSYAYLDVFESEPFFEKDFIEVGNVTLTSHIAGVHNSVNKGILNFEREVINDFIHNSERIEEFNNKYSDSILQNKLFKDFLI